MMIKINSNGIFLTSIQDTFVLLILTLLLMKHNRPTPNGYFNGINLLKVIFLIMALAFLQEETFASSREDVTISAPAAASTGAAPKPGGW